MVELDMSLLISISNIREALAAPGDFRVEIPVPHGDPYSTEYRDGVLAQYAAMTGRPYVTNYEEHPFDLHEPDRDWSVKPWPYSTEQACVVGEHLIATGHMIRAIAPLAGERVLEMGAGWGNLALPLATMGCDVTALELESRYVRILQARAVAAKVKLNVVQKSFLEVGKITDKFDLIVFCAAFHHCHDHHELLRLVVDRLAPGGRLALCGEPLDEGLDYPWGLNNRREGINQIVTHGWFELAFRVSYLMELLRRAGLTPSITVCSETAMGNVIMAKTVRRQII